MKHKLNTLIERIKGTMERHPKRWMAAGTVVFVVLIGVILLALTKEETQVTRTTPEVTISEDKIDTVATAPAPLTGVEVAEDLAQRPVTAIVIENSPEARPQSSLHEAGVVFESIAEGGVTRYLAFYQETSPDVIGPIRSLRPYFIDWVLTFDASIAHVGGSAEALQQAQDLGLKDLDEFVNETSFYRTADRFAPHNLYSDFERLDALNTRLGYTNSNFEPWTRKLDAPLTTPTAATITIPISSLTYEGSYTYLPSTNSYLRSTGGEAATDRETNSQINPKVVIVLEAPSTINEDGRYVYDLVGSGKVTVFQDGDVTVGTWTKNTRSSQYSFTSDNGNEIALNAGNTWVTIIQPSQEVEYLP